MQTFRDVVGLWPSAEALASDLHLRGGTVRQWVARNSIPAAYWPEVVAAAEARGFRNVTVALLAALVPPTGRRARVQVIGAVSPAGTADAA